MSSPPPTIDDIPAELLLKIFKLCVEPRQGPGHYHTLDTDLRHRRSVVLSHGCQKWRALTLGDLTLWTDIRLTGTAKLEMLYFERSRPLPIDLTVDLVAMERRREGVDCAAIIGCKLLALPLKDRTRIQSIRATHFRHHDARSMVSCIDRLNLPALSALFIRTTSSDPYSYRQRRWGRLEVHSLLDSDALTTLELHGRRQILDGRVVKRALESCPRLETLVVGGLSLARDPSEPDWQVSLKRLAVGSPIFRRPEEHVRCTARCPCPFRNLVVDNLEYIEVAGGAIEDTLRHLLPIIKRRGTDVRHTSLSRDRLLTIVLNSHSLLKFSGGRDFKGLAQSLPHDINLHIFHASSDYSQKIQFCEWFKHTRSTCLYVLSGVAAHSVIWSGQPGIAPYRLFQPRQGFTPALIHPDAAECTGLGDSDMETRGWILPGSGSHGPYLDATQPNSEDTADSDPPKLVMSARRSRPYIDLDLDLDFDWQGYRRSLGWPDNYDTPSD
ncbi:hypothetical protein FA13DRAFT_1729447 [Coprinellus micaceus]|uniref:F-box domain-containing protein n=1 Tax=Coprinellus micaceus TaxID=71717 RepID=A0A4Y7TKS3_COPMI|nr:hypothetical protein FA13DRAFT_1729447 [Coprinellus micaceus]